MKFRELQDTFTIPLTRSQVALVDERDWQTLNKEKTRQGTAKWSATWNAKTQSYYAQRSIQLSGRKRTTQTMHRFIMGLGPNDRRQVDHLNHDTLDNRRQNLRIVTQRENHENRRDQSDYGPGIQKLKFLRTRPFRALVQINGRMLHVGCYATPEEAVVARKRFLRVRGPNTI